MGFSWRLFLEEMFNKGVLSRADVDFFSKEENINQYWVGFVVRLNDKLQEDKAKLVECEKHVRESVSEGFGEWWADFVKRDLGPEIVAVPDLKIKKSWQAAKASSLVEIEQLKAENERLKLHDIPGYQEGIEELKAHIEELIERLAKGE